MSPIISSSPHLRSKLDTPRIMLEVIISLIPAALASVILFRQKAIILIITCMAVSVITEKITLHLLKKSYKTIDYSASLTGLLLALILPPSTSIYAAILGSIFAILVTKQLFGGLGANIFNPALMGRALLMAAYPSMLTTFSAPFVLDTITGATPLAGRKFDSILTPIKDLFLGNISGSLGETSALCLILGGAYLIIRKIADWRVPLTMIAATSILSGIFYSFNSLNGPILFHLFSGGFMLGVFFMATDPVTTPVTKKGRYIFGIGAAIVTMVIRLFGGFPEGVMYSILFMNAFTPLINKYTKPKSFGR